MSMINNLVNRLRAESKSMGRYGVDYMSTLLMDASDTIIMLSKKARADRPRAKWLERNNGYDTTCECSACHYRDFIPNYQIGGEYICMDRYWFERAFCPNCGADMRGDKDDKR